MYMQMTWSRLMQVLWILLQSVSSYELCSVWFREPSLLDVLYSLWLTLFTSSCTGFPEPWGEGFNGDISFRTESSKISHPLNITWMWASIFVFICCWKKFLWWWLSTAMIYEYITTSLESFYCYIFFFRTIVVDFTLGSCAV